MVRPEPQRRPTRKRTDKKRKETIQMVHDGEAQGVPPKLPLDPHSSHNSMMVVLRVRPMTEKEKMEDPFYDNGEEAVRVMDGQMVVVMDATYQYCDPTDVLKAKRNREKQYAFHRAFGGSAQQQDVYEVSVRPVIEGLIDGINATIFAYGATGTGKTYTMIGNMESAGVTVLTVADLFDAIEQTSADKEYRLTMSYMEVYNETIRDLLNPASKSGLELREDPVRGVCCAGITEVSPTSVDEVMELLHLGNKYRTTEMTDANKTSSRSHAMMQICIEQQDKTPGVHTEVRVSKLSMIDLAGSERASNTNNRGLRMVEGANINRSLLALGNCINALGVNGGDVKFVPYRDSKLTRLLKDSLGGSCRTVMIATLSPCSGNYEENINTLKYASRAINIRNKVTRNVIQVAHHISEYTEIIKKLRDEVSTLKLELTSTAGDRGGGGHQARPSHQSLESYEHLHNSVFEKFSDRLDLIGSLADHQQDSMLAEMNQRLELGPLAHHETLPSIKDTMTRNARKATPEPLEPLEFEKDEKHRKLITDLQYNEHMIEKVGQSANITEPQMKENLRLLCDNKMLESSNLELKRRVGLHTMMQNHSDMYVRLLENELRIRDRQLQVADGNLDEDSEYVEVPKQPLRTFNQSELIASNQAHAPLDVDKNPMILPVIPRVHTPSNSSHGTAAVPKNNPSSRQPNRPGSKATSVSQFSDGSAKQLMLKRRQQHRAAAAEIMAGLSVAGTHIEVASPRSGFDTLPGGGGGVGGQGSYKVAHSYAPEKDLVGKRPRRLSEKRRLQRIPMIRQRGVSGAMNAASANTTKPSVQVQPQEGSQAASRRGKSMMMPHKPSKAPLAGDRGRAAALVRINASKRRY